MTRLPLSLRPGAGMLLLVLSGVAIAQTPQTTTTRYQYDANGNLTRITDPLGRVTDHSYDALNRLQQQLQPAPVAGAARPAIQYSHDGQDRLVSVTDPRNLVTRYTLDGLGNQTALSSPDTGTTSKTFDAAGNLTTSTDAKGQTTTYSYDALHRVTRIVYADGNAIAYEYDQGPNAIGRLSRLSDSSGSTAYAYDSKGRITAETRTLDGATYVTAYAYDNAGRLASLTYPSGRVVSYTRDDAGRIRQIDVSLDGASQTVVSQVSYRPFGGVQSFVNGAGRTVTRGFDLDGRLTSFTLHDQTQLVTYDAASRITALWNASNAAHSHSFGYDDLDRLTQYSGTGVNQSFGYDAVGNRTSQLLGSGSYSYSTSSGANRLTQVSGPGGNKTYTYDANGSLINNGQKRFTHDARGRMVSANTALGLVQYRLNGLGQRVQKSTPAATTVFHYDSNGQLIGERTGPYSVDYVYLHDIPVAVFK